MAQPKQHTGPTTRGFAERIRDLPAQHPYWTAFALACLVVAVFGRAAWFGYIPLDDPDYVKRPQLATGLTVDTFRWAFTTFDEANWHPLTWLSYLLDATLFGAGPAVFHATNIVLHSASSALLFLALRSLTAAPRRSLLVALLFAIHPLHVESVVWVAERKDVLSGFFFAALLLAWSRYAQAGGLARYGLVVALMALGLLAKPMLVTAPFVLLLLDVWPLGRTPLVKPAVGVIGSPVPLPRLLAEKVPLLALSAAVSALTFLAQGSGGAFSDVVPLRERLLNAMVTIPTYLGKTLWPASLAVFYPLRLGSVSASSAMLSGAAILLGTGLAAWQARKRPWVAVGWCWYIGMLVPVLGIVQVGGQAMADRYTYLPLVGMFLIAAWAAGDVVARLGGTWRPVALCGLAAILMSLLAAAIVQVGYWRDDTSLFEHAAAVTERNWLAQQQLGVAAYQAGRRGEAERYFVESIASNPEFADTHFHYGLLLSESGDQVNAIAEYRRAIELFPTNPAFHNNLGNALYLMGKREEAVAQYREALRLNPGDALAAENLQIAGGR